jgi:hypothetical protein
VTAPRRREDSPAVVDLVDNFASILVGKIPTFLSVPWSPFSGGRPLHDLCCSIHMSKSMVECDPPCQWNDDHPRANVAVEHPASDAAIGRGIAIADQAVAAWRHGVDDRGKRTMQRWSYEVVVTRMFSFTSNTPTKGIMEKR